MKTVFLLAALAACAFSVPVERFYQQPQRSFYPYSGEQEWSFYPQKYEQTEFNQWDQEYFRTNPWMTKKYQQYNQKPTEGIQQQVLQQWEQYFYNVQQKLEQFQGQIPQWQWQTYYQVVNRFLTQIRYYQQQQQHLPSFYFEQEWRQFQQYVTYWQREFENFFQYQVQYPRSAYPSINEKWQHEQGQFFNFMDESVTFEQRFQYVEKYLNFVLQQLEQTKDFQQRESFLKIVKDFFYQMEQLKDRYYHYVQTREEIPFNFNFQIKSFLEHVYYFQQEFQKYYTYGKSYDLEYPSEQLSAYRYPSQQWTTHKYPYQQYNQEYSYEQQFEQLEKFLIYIQKSLKENKGFSKFEWEQYMQTFDGFYARFFELKKTHEKYAKNGEQIPYEFYWQMRQFLPEFFNFYVQLQKNYPEYFKESFQFFFSFHGGYQPYQQYENKPYFGKYQYKWERPSSYFYGQFQPLSKYFEYQYTSPDSTVQKHVSFKKY